MPASSAASRALSTASFTQVRRALRGLSKPRRWRFLVKNSETEISRCRAPISTAETVAAAFGGAGGAVGVRATAVAIATLISDSRSRAVFYVEPRHGSPHHHGVGQSLEISVTRHELRPEAPGRRIYERVGHREAVGEGKVRGLEGQRLVDRRDGRSTKGRHCLHRTLLADVSPDDLVDLVHLDG